MTVKNDTMSVLGLNSGYTVKYNPLPSGKGLYLTVYPSSRPNTDTVYFLAYYMFCLLAYTHIQEGNIERVTFEYNIFKMNIMPSIQSSIVILFIFYLS